MIKIIQIFLILLLSSCSLLEKGDFEKLDFPHRPALDEYSSHLEGLGRDYLRTPGIKEIKLSYRSRKYLYEMFQRISANNELLLDKTQKPKFHIIKGKTPFYFSLPNSNFYLSSNLVSKYLGNEELFASVISYMSFVSHNRIYVKNLIVPVGFISTQKILALTRIPLKEKNKVNKWTYFILKRSGYDPYAYLIWLQTQNKNSLDFTMQHGSSQYVSREEFHFKKYISTLGVQNKKLYRRSSNSSKEFYHFYREVKRKNI